jgi:hypothetical protein
VPEKKIVASDFQEAMARLDWRLELHPVLAATKQALGREMGRLAADRSLANLASNLAAGNLSLEEAALSLAQKAADLLNAALEEEQRVAAGEEQGDRTYRGALEKGLPGRKIIKKRPRERAAYTVRGQVKHPVSGVPLAGLVVEAVDRDPSKPGVLGADVTDATGAFEITFGAKWFKEVGEAPPEVVLRVGVERKRPLLRTSEAVRPKPGEEATLSIMLPEAEAKAAEWLQEQREAVTVARLKELERTVAFNRLHHLQVQEMGRVFKEGLAQAIEYLKARV